MIGDLLGIVTEGFTIPKNSVHKIMQGGIPGVEEETYFSSCLDSAGQGTGVHSVL